MKALREIIDLFRPPRAEVLAERELEDARRKLLEAMSGLEYANAMVEYHRSRVQRLTTLVHPEVQIVHVASDGTTTSTRYTH